MKSFEPFIKIKRTLHFYISIFHIILFASILFAQDNFYDRYTSFNVPGILGLNYRPVAVSGNSIVCCTELGVHIYHYNGTAWIHQAILDVGITPLACDIDNDVIVIACIDNSARIYEYDGVDWIQQAVFSVGAWSDWADVAISGRTIVLNTRTTVEIYQFRNNEWVSSDHINRVTQSVDIDSNTIIISGGTWDPETISYFAEIFVLNNEGKAILTGHLSPTHDEIRNMGAEYGRSSAISGNHAVVSAPYSEWYFSNMWWPTGAMYIYKKENGGWVEDYFYTPDFITFYMGFSVDIDNNTVVAGSQSKEIYIFRKGENWSLVQHFIRNPEVMNYFTAIKDGTVITSSYNDDILNIYELIARPGNFRASDGKDNLVFNWTDRSGIEEGFQIQVRNEFESKYYNLNGDEIINRQYTVPDPEAYVPGKLYEFSIAAYDGIWGESVYMNDIGWIKPNGTIRGDITTKGTIPVGVPGITVHAYCSTLNHALLFDGADDYVIHYPFMNFPLKALTVEFWMKSSDQSSGKQLISYATGESDNTFSLYDQNGFILNIKNNNSDNTGVRANDGLWHHVAVTWRSVDGQMELYKNSALSYTGIVAPGDSMANGGSLVIAQDQDQIGGGFDPSQAYNGYIDEVRIWNKVRSGEDIKADMHRILTGDEDGLVCYWTFNEGRSDRIGDYAVNGGHYGEKCSAAWTDDAAYTTYMVTTNDFGQYYIPYIYCGEEGEVTYTVRPDTSGGREFSPQSLPATMRYSASNPDLYQITGINFTDESFYGLSGRIQYSDLDYFLPDVELFLDNASLAETETDENGTFSMPIQTGQHTIKPRLYNHTFVPAETTLTIRSAVSGILFKDTTHYTLKGRVAGGNAGYYLGEATIQIKGPNNCFETTIKTRADSFKVKLPAIPDICVSVTEIDDVPVNDFFNDGKLISSKTISMVKGDTVLNFIYYAKPRIVVKGLPDPTTVHNVPVLTQTDISTVKISIIEDYGDNRITTVDSGSISILNDIPDKITQSEIEIDDRNEYSLSFRIGVPNIIPGGAHPYQKRLYILTHTRGGEMDTSLWVIVTGYRPREQTFATVSPAIPLMILRDPPGDHSYSYLEDAMTTRLTTSMSMLKDMSENNFMTLKAGVAFSIGASTPWGSFSQEQAFWLLKDQQITMGSSALNQDEQQITLTTLERYETSGQETDIGAEGDVFIGAAFNIIYALADILTINDIGEVELSKNIIYGLDNDDAFETTYIYTKKHIENILLPRFRENLSAETGLDGIQYWKDQIEAWEQILLLNDSLKIIANEPVAGQTSISISGGSAKYFSSTLEQTVSRTLEFNSYIDENVAREAGLEIFGSGYKRGVQTRTRFNLGQSIIKDTTISHTVGYCIFDDEYSDNYWINIKGDPVYGTPVFNLQLGSYTSWPWERGTIPHEQCVLNIAGDYIQTGVDPNEKAVFTLELTNISPSGRAGSYKLFDIPTSNPDGAELSLFGVPISSVSPYLLQAYETATVPLKVSIGPYAYDYDDLQLKLQSLYDEQIADTVTFSLHFTAPCSPMRISEPEDNWVLNKNNHDSLKILLTDYDKNKMSDILIQYKPLNRTKWENSLQITAANIPDNNAVIYWETKGLPEGIYDLRTRVSWNQATGYTYSNKICGIIDRIPPKVFGDPQPSDGVLHSGDQISVTFNEMIHPNSVISQNATLLNTKTGTPIPVNLSNNERTIIFSPQVTQDVLENQSLKLSLINISDQHGNISDEAIIWSFLVNTNPVHWSVNRLSKTILQGESWTPYAKLINEGGLSSSFSLSSLPSWLEADTENGSIPALGEQIITFSLNSSVPSGFYRDTIYAVTPGGNEPLFFELQVQYPAPQWNINPVSFDNSMTVLAGFYIEDVPFSNENDIIAVFKGDELRGVVKVQKIVPLDEYIGFLMVYSDQIREENLRFVIWDASEGVEREIQESLVFVADTTYGISTSPLRLHILGALLQRIPLAQDWNWFSLGVEARDMSTRQILSTLKADDGDLVKGHTSYAQYLGGVGWVGPLDTLQPGASFKIYLKQSRTLDFIGAPVPAADRPIAIDPGWNWIGYLPDEILDINDALASLDETSADGDLIKNQHVFSIYTQSRWQGLLESMAPGEGYMLKAQNGGTLTYPASEGKMIHLSKMMSARALNDAVPDWSVEAASYEYSMNITGVLSIDGLPVTNSNTIIAAFINEDCRGLCKPIYMLDRWTYFTTIYSNDAVTDSIILKVYDADRDQVREIYRKHAFSPDMIIGSPGRPVSWWVGIPTGFGEEEDIPKEFALHQNYPNPFNPSTIIRYDLKQAEHVKLVIYDILGQRIRILVDEVQDAGRYKLYVNPAELAAGLYFYKIKAGSFEKTRKMLLVR